MDPVATDLVDGIYFCMATMSTVGYGDMKPTTGVTRGFSLLLILFGILFVFSKIGRCPALLPGSSVRAAFMCEISVRDQARDGVIATCCL